MTAALHARGVTPFAGSPDDEPTSRAFTADGRRRTGLLR